MVLPARVRDYNKKCRHPIMREHGFSFIELLIVMLMISIITSGAAISIRSFSSPEKRLNKIGLQLLARMNFALDESLMQRRVIGLGIDNTADSSTYYWYRYEQQRWLRMRDTLRAFTLPNNMTLQVTVAESFQERLLENTLNVSVDDTKKSVIPDIVFYPSGDISPFSLQLGFKKYQEIPILFSIFIDERGELSHTLSDH